MGLVVYTLYWIVMHGSVQVGLSGLDCWLGLLWLEVGLTGYGSSCTGYELKAESTGVTTCERTIHAMGEWVDGYTYLPDHTRCLPLYRDRFYRWHGGQISGRVELDRTPTSSGSRYPNTTIDGRWKTVCLGRLISLLIVH